jgi:hypothetical protein
MSPRAVVLAAVCLSAACARGSRPLSPAAPLRQLPCLIAGDSIGSARPATVVFDDPEDAELARQATDRLAPARLDCEGRMLPGLARSWSRDSTGRFWTLELGPGDRPAEGEPRWTAAALAATWRADPTAASALRLAGVTATVPLDDRRLVLGLAAPAAAVPAVLADRALAVAVGGRSGLEPSLASGDLRDAVDSGVDVVVTGSPGVLDYAGRRPGITLIPLPWSRRYLLVVPAGEAALALPADTVAFRTALANDAVRMDARAAPPGWSDSVADCRPAALPPAPASPAILYPADDTTARELAERLVALSRRGLGQARGLDPAAFAAALAAGGARAYLVRAPARSLAPCAVARTWPAGSSIVALVETRDHAIVRRGAPPLAVAWDGALHPVERGDTVEATP